jgi:hypothetical protein
MAQVASRRFLTEKAQVTIPVGFVDGKMALEQTILRAVPSFSASYSIPQFVPHSFIIKCSYNSAHLRLEKQGTQSHPTPTNSSGTGTIVPFEAGETRD